MAEFKDQFTLDGRVKPANHYVTRAKVAEADKLLTAAMRGDKIAAGKLAEVHTTSDMKFNIAHLISVTAIPQFDAAPRTWTQIAKVRTVPDFGPVRLMSMFGNLTGAGIHEKGGLVDVPEGAPYPYVSITGQEAFYAKIKKMGTKFGFTWEANISDIVGFFEQIPGELVQAALDTEEREVYTALVNGTTTVLAGGALPDGTVVPINAPISPNAIWEALLELPKKTVNGKLVGASTNGYNVIVPIGVKAFIDWKLAQPIISILDGTVTLGSGDRSALQAVTIIESAFVTGTQWYVLPKPGGVIRPVLELGRLRGYESPELRVNNDTGTYVGGSAVSPFEGNFDNDSIDYRIRYVCGGILWDGSYSLYSKGTGVA